MIYNDSLSKLSKLGINNRLFMVSSRFVLGPNRLGDQLVNGIFLILVKIFLYKGYASSIHYIPECGIFIILLNLSLLSLKIFFSPKIIVVSCEEVVVFV